MTNTFQIIRGLDACYVIDDGELIKIVEVKYSENYFKFTGGWVEYTLENGMIIKVD